MSIRVIAQGTVMGTPEDVESDRQLAAFILGTRQEIDYRGQRVELDDVATCEIVCVGELADAALRCVEGDHVVVSGILRIHTDQQVLGEEPESANVRLEIHADGLGRS